MGGYTIEIDVCVTSLLGSCGGCLHDCLHMMHTSYEVHTRCMNLSLAMKIGYIGQTTPDS